MIIDGDDTLWDTQVLYEKAKKGLVELLSGTSEAREVLETLSAVDVRNIRRHGLSRRRFPASAAETYRILLARHGSSDPAGERQAAEIAEAVFEERALVYPDVPEALRCLSETHVPVLFTAGDREVQCRRIQDSGLRPYFTNVVISPAKSISAWSDLVASLGAPPTTMWSVGNSIRSDINPALALGLRCVLLERPTWEYERVGARPGPVWRAGTLAEAVDLIQAEAST